MNAMLSTTIPLPAILDQPAFAGPGRRHRIENYDLTPLDVERFNNLLLRLGRRQAPLDQRPGSHRGPRIVRLQHPCG